MNDDVILLRRTIAFAVLCVRKQDDTMEANDDAVLDSHALMIFRYICVYVFRVSA